jgi:hypothetical protein
MKSQDNAGAFPVQLMKKYGSAFAGGESSLSEYVC